MPEFSMKKVLTALCSVLVFTGTAEASLVDRGGGMIYDTTLNITWLADMNYAKTSGYDSYGFLGWAEANDWANNLVYGGFSGWRLPTINPSDTSCSGTAVGAPGIGYNCIGGELSHLFVADLGNKAGESVLYQTGDTAEQIANLALFSNVQSNFYWSGTGFAPNARSAWLFAAHYGLQSLSNVVEAFNAVAVRDGDVAASIPEPATLALVGLAFVGVVASRKHGSTAPTA
jgi:hypothetical protein